MKRRRIFFSSICSEFGAERNGPMKHLAMSHACSYCIYTTLRISINVDDWNFAIFSLLYRNGIDRSITDNRYRTDVSADTLNQ